MKTVTIRKWKLHSFNKQTSEQTRLTYEHTYITIYKYIVFTYISKLSSVGNQIPKGRRVAMRGTEHEAEQARTVICLFLTDTTT